MALWDRVLELYHLREIGGPAHMIKEIGQKIFYEIDTGNILVSHPSVRGDEAYVKERPLAEIIDLYPVLRDRDQASFDVIELNYGELDEDFAQSSEQWVDPETKQLKFAYRDPNAPEEPPVFRKPLTEEVEALKQENTLLKAQNTALSERADFIEDVVAEMAMQVYQ